MNISSIFQQMLILFLTIGVGYLAVKLKLVDAAFSKGLSRILVNFTTPAMILNSVLASEKVLPNRQVLLLTLLAIGSFAALILIALPLPKLLGVPKKQQNVYRFLTIFNNVGFMGFPVAEAIFGIDAVFFVSIFQIPFNLLCFTYGTWLISDGRAGLSLKNFFSPILISSVVSYILYLLNFQAPAFLVNLTGFLGRVTSPAAMLLVGFALAAVPLKDVFSDWRMYLLYVVKLILIPVAAWLVLRQFISHELILGITIVMMAMPAGTNATLLAAQYDGDGATCAKGVFMTTLLSVVTIPVLMSLMF